MTANRPGPRRRRILGPLISLLLLLGLTLVAPPAHAAETSVTLTLSRAEVVDGRLHLAGTVTNTSAAPLRTLTVQLWRSTRPLVSRDAVEKALTEKTTTDGGVAGGQTATLTLTSADTQIQPGQTSGFAVDAATTTLGLTSAASYWVGVDAVGRAVGEKPIRTLGTARTLASLTRGPVPVASVVELSSRPRQIKADLFTDDGLAEELSTGRLRTLLNAAASRDADWFVDPSLLAEVCDMADGYFVLAGAERVRGEGQEAAQSWLAGFEALDAARGHAGLFGTPDLAAAGASRLPDLPRTAVAAGDRVEGPSSRAALLVSPDAATLGEVAPLGVPVLALGIKPPQAVSRTEGVTIVEADQPSFAPTDLLPDTPLNRRTTLAALAASTRGQVRWLRTPADLESDTDPLPAGFVRTTLATVLALEPGSWAPTAPSRGGVLTPETVQRLTALGETLRTYGAVAPSSGVGDLADAQVARGASLWWADAEARQQAWFDAIDRRIAPTAEPALALDASPRFSMTGATSDFPVTVTNHLPDPVVVRVAVGTDNPQRIRFTPPEPVTVAPGASNTVMLAASAAGGGVVTARVHLEAVDGLRLTPDTEITVETTNFGAIAWTLVIGSGIVLVVSTALRIKKVRARQKGVGHG